MFVGLLGELQVLDDSSDKYKNLKEYQYHGSIYGVVPAKRGYQKPVGEWNTQEVTVKGKQVKVVLNGETIVDADIEKASTPKTIDGNKHPDNTPAVINNVIEGIHVIEVKKPPGVPWRQTVQVVANQQVKVRAFRTAMSWLAGWVSSRQWNSTSPPAPSTTAMATVHPRSRA